MEWVSDGEPAAREHLADHAAGGDTSLIAMRDHRVMGIVTIRWQSNQAGFRDRGIPWFTKIAVAGPFRRLGIAALLMNAAEELGSGRGAVMPGITAGLFDQFGPADGCMPCAATFRMAREPVAARNRLAKERG